MTKRYSSVTSIAFTVEHDSEDGSDITEGDMREALMRRYVDIVTKKECLEATGGELVDTQENE